MINIPVIDTFRFHFGDNAYSPVRIFTDSAGTPWLVAKDVCDILGFRDAYTGVRGLDDDEKKLMTLPTQNVCIEREQYVINESGFYSLVLKSKRPEAKVFKKWVTSEVLPQIRKTGGYIPAKAEDSDETIMARALMIADKTIKNLELDNAEMHEKLDYSTVDAYRALHKGEYWPHGRSISLGLRAAHICRSRDIEIRTEMRDVEYRRTNGLKGTTVKGINVYPTYVLDEAYAAMRGAA